MRVERLELTGIGPFRNTQVIDFAQLAESGLFLIDGPTGAGKTTIIDAIVFALFSGLSGNDSSKERLRSDHSLGTEKSEVILDFSVHGRKHRITRSPAYQAAKANCEGFTNKPAKQSLIEYHPDGSVKTTLTSATDIGVHVSRLLNMQAAQFRQLVVLAQGEFAALLRMKPKERLEALRGLLGTQFFQDLQNTIADQGLASRQLLADSHKALRELATRVTAFRTDDNAADLDPPLQVISAEDSTSPESEAAFDLVVELFEVSAIAAEVSAEVSAEQLKGIELSHGELIELHKSLVELNQAREALESSIAALDPVDSGVEPKSAGRLAQELNVKVGTLAPLVEWEMNSAKRELELQSLTDTVNRLTSDLADFDSEFELLPNKLAELKVSLGERTTLRNELKIATERRGDVETLLAKMDQLRIAQVNEQDAVTVLADCTAILNQAELELERFRTELMSVKNQQLTQRVAVLAAELVTGEACLVCGSLEHPNPATATDLSDLVTELDIAAAEELVEDKSAVVAELMDDRDAAEKVKQAASLAVAGLQGAVGESTAESMATELSELDKNILGIESSLAELEDIEGEISRVELELSEGSKNRTGLQTELTEAENSLRILDTQNKKVMADIVTAVGEGVTAHKEQHNLIRRVEMLGGVAESYARVFDREASMPVTVLSAEEITSQYSELQSQLVVAKELAKETAKQAAVARSQAESIKEIRAEFGALLKRNEKLQREHSTRIRLAGIVTAQSSQNTKKLPLESYALQLRFHHVLEAASHHLEKMSAGRLSFVLDEESQSNAQSGLGIDVLDSWTGESRPPSSLSGGETFYASLSLALGLADVVQAETGGVSLETLFVDEGFGSLDQESLQLVLDQLDQLKSGGRVIGVISHVSEMKERFPDRIYVEPQSDGTSVVIQEATS